MEADGWMVGSRSTLSACKIKIKYLKPKNEDLREPKLFKRLNTNYLLNNIHPRTAFINFKAE